MKRYFTVRQGALDGVETFLSVARHKSFRKASAELGVTPSAVSQTIRTLETRVGAALFTRTTRSVGLTEAGARFLERAKPAFEELLAATDVARGLGRRPAGTLRLTVPRAVVPILLAPLIASFCEAYPEIVLEISANEELVELTSGGFDAGIRLGQFVGADMVAVPLTKPFPFVVVGSPDYFRRKKAPTRIVDLREHACLRMRRTNGSIAPWTFIDGNKTVDAMVSGPFVATDFLTLLGTAIEGVGLAQIPEPVANDPMKAGKLVRVLKPFEPHGPGVFLYYPDRRQIAPKLRAFIDHAKTRSQRAKRLGRVDPPPAPK